MHGSRSPDGISPYKLVHSIATDAPYTMIYGFMGVTLTGSTIIKF